jgi:hypothetical protein
MSKTPLFASCTFIAGLLLTIPAFAQTTASVMASGLSMPLGSTSNGTINEKDIYCPIGVESILPGDYYACEARAAYGRGNYNEMLGMLEESASWANKDAQYALGLAYFNGDTPTIPQNKPLGLAWLALAAERKNQQYVLTYAEARSKVSQGELLQAQTMWKQMRPKYGDAIAAKRAIEHFNHNVEMIDKSAQENGTVYMRGFSQIPMSSLFVANQLHDEATTDFEDLHGTVVVGKPIWVKSASASDSSNTQTPQP